VCPPGAADDDPAAAGGAAGGGAGAAPRAARAPAASAGAEGGAAAPRKRKAPAAKKPWCPKYKTANFALLVTLDRLKRQGSVTVSKAELVEAAEASRLSADGIKPRAASTSAAAATGGGKQYTYDGWSGFQKYLAGVPQACLRRTAAAAAPALRARLRARAASPLPRHARRATPRPWCTRSATR
jgi:hypothetical protein